MFVQLTIMFVWFQCINIFITIPKDEVFVTKGSRFTSVYNLHTYLRRLDPNIVHLFSIAQREQGSLWAVNTLKSYLPLQKHLCPWAKYENHLACLEKKRNRSQFRPNIDRFIACKSRLRQKNPFLFATWFMSFVTDVRILQ